MLIVVGKNKLQGKKGILGKGCNRCMAIMSYLKMGKYH